MADGICPHCGQSHIPGAACPVGGQDLPVPGKSVLTLLNEAFELYRTHARALLMTCALLFVPATLVKSCALSAIMAPSLLATTYQEETAALGAKVTEASRRALEQGVKNGQLDPATVKSFSEQSARSFEELGRQSAVASGAVLGGFTLFALGLLGTLVTAFFLYGIIVPLTNGALTVAVADRILGGEASWRQVWMLLFRRVGKLLTALIPGALLVAVGFLLFVVPGMILAFLFVFTAQVVLIEGIGGTAALKRSVALVRQDWLRVAVVLIVFGVIRWLALALAGIFIPRSAPFWASLFGDLFTLVLMPVPVIGAVLLYFDLRRTHEGFTQDRLRADLAALKTPAG